MRPARLERAASGSAAWRVVVTLKAEWVYHLDFATREQAGPAIFDYVEMFYNRTRRHSHLGGVSPEAFEAASNHRLYVTTEPGEVHAT